jgi:N6-L-threonylcarbamoyladenine synthase
VSTAPETVLAIETSCDETCAAVVRGREVLSNVVASQFDLHGRFGGVVPEIASRHHLENVDAVIAAALETAGCDMPDRIAVTRGPGLIGALLVGVAAAKARAFAWDRPLVAVDHLAGHIASVLLSDNPPELPYLCMLASGGHTLVLDVEADLTVTLLGSTRDDAAGEAFDKGARLLGLGMPGGPKLEACAREGDPGAVPFTPGMVHHDTVDVSFAGLKTALANAVAERGGLAHLDEKMIADLAASYQRAIVATITASTRKLLKQNSELSGGKRRRSRLALVGGVAANSTLRSEIELICAKNDVELSLAPLPYGSDNAAMIGVAAPFFPALDPAAMRTLDAFATSSLFRHGRLVPMELP